MVHVCIAATARQERRTPTRMLFYASVVLLLTPPPCLGSGSGLGERVVTLSRSLCPRPQFAPRGACEGASRSEQQRYVLMRERDKRVHANSARTSITKEQGRHRFGSAGSVGRGAALSGQRGASDSAGRATGDQNPLIKIPLPLLGLFTIRSDPNCREASAPGPPRKSAGDGGAFRPTQQHRQRHRQRDILAGWIAVRRNRNLWKTGTDSTSRSRTTSDSEWEQETAHAASASASARETAMVTTLAKTSSLSKAATGSPPAKVSTAAKAGKVTRANPPSPVPSYLQWTTQDSASETAHTVGEPSTKARLPLGPGRRWRKARSARSRQPKENAALEKATETRGGAGAISLTFTEAMFAGAVSRSIAQTCMQPMNVVKTLLQGRGTSSQLSNLSFKLLTRGAGAQFVMSLPHGAFNFATLEVILGCSAKIFPTVWRETAGPVLDFVSSSAATLVCSVISTPQMVITDRIMAGMYPNLAQGVREITRTQGVGGFYTGWSANVAQKIPSYGLTWVFFQQFKRLHRKSTNRTPTNTENFLLGAAAAGATVCIMIPMDTVKTRLVTQTAHAGVVPYRGVLPTLFRVVREEGVGPLYRSLAPRLASVVPMIGIQFGIYEFVRKELMSRKIEDRKARPWGPRALLQGLGFGSEHGSQQPDYVKDFLRNVYLLEEELL